MKQRASNGRIVGLDLARALAIFGMIIVNYKLAMGAQDAGPYWLRTATGIFEGRASALFVILAGIGVSLMTARARASGEEQTLKANRKTLYRRAAFLFLAGIFLLEIGWSADILHYYAVFIALSALLLQSSNKRLLAWIIFILITTVFQLIFLDYSYGWSEDYHEYVKLWTWSGFVRNLLFNGFHPLFPWLAFFLLGLWLGRKEWLKRKEARSRLLVISASIALLTEVGSRFIVREFTPVLGPEGAQSLFGSKPMPPNLIYVGAAAASALAVLVLCIQVAERWKESKWVQALISTGQLSLTHYVAHVVIGLAPLQWIGMLENGSVVFSTIYAFLFYITAIAISLHWKKRYGRGPLELLMRSWDESNRA
ncbi:DUF418 domain-containing protein [Paenibacillus sp. NPDC056933]|uniref:DUF418 domain-containing protein n=1 Tax=Paenibacillus sp. NPDC056933 TaxID=3345968 RepID=UPI003632F1D5